jgi:CubicO group peptidase (beta-lactamase class C family)
MSTPEDVASQGGGEGEAAVPGIELWNRPEVHRCEAPAANLIATARAITRFYVMLVNRGELDGVRVLQPDTVARATREAVFANPDRTLGVPVRWAYGFHLGGGRYNPFGSQSLPTTFGHAGHGSTSTWGDPVRKLAYVYLTNGVRDRASNTQRQAALADAVLSACN